MVPQLRAFSSCHSGRRPGATTGLSLLNHFTEPGAVTQPRPGGQLVTGVARCPVIFRASLLAFFPPSPDLPRGCVRVRVCKPRPGVSSSRHEAGCGLCSAAAAPPFPGPSVQGASFQGRPSCRLSCGEPCVCIRGREDTGKSRKGVLGRRNGSRRVAVFQTFQE